MTITDRTSSAPPPAPSARRPLRGVLVAAAASKARADTGVYADETFSAAGYGRGLKSYGDTAFRFTFAMNVRHDAWTLGVIGGFAATDDWHRNNADYSLMGVDLRKTWQLNELHPFKPRRAGVRASLGGGPRWFEGQRTLTGYSGPGVTADVRLEGDFFVIGYYIDIGVDAMWMQMPADHVVGVVPFIGIGGKLGWL